MAKAGTGKGNAFASPGLSYPHLALVRQDGQRNAAEQAALRSPEEDRIVNLADVILDLSARRRVKSDIKKALGRARRGLDPLFIREPCSGCVRHGGTHFFLCQPRLEKAHGFGKKEEKKAYLLVAPALQTYAAECKKLARRLASRRVLVTREMQTHTDRATR